MAKLEGFDIAKDRIDTFYHQQLCISIKYPMLWKLMKITFTLSHGQADMERGFSINKDTLKTNMTDKTLIARRFIYNSVEVGIFFSLIRYQCFYICYI